MVVRGDDPSEWGARAQAASRTANVGRGEGLHARLDGASSRGLSLEKKSNTIGLELVTIPAGRFTMGSPRSEKERGEDEHQVAVNFGASFLLAKTTVTQAQWKAVMGTTPWVERGTVESGDEYPAVYVSAADAAGYCAKLTAVDRAQGILPAEKGYRLPTEAEWEYACRAGTTTAYSFGDDPSFLGDHAWYEENSLRVMQPGDDSGGEIAGHAGEVGTKKPNPWGLYDMHGNVWEWCADWYAEALVGGADPQGPADGTLRVFRGGNWTDRASFARSAFRGFGGADARGRNLGFRVVCSRP